MICISFISISLQILEIASSYCILSLSKIYFPRILSEQPPRNYFNSIAGSTTDTVHARKLHEFLGIGRDYSNWIKARIKQYSFVENEDFILVRHNGRIKIQGGDRRSIEHHITLDMAKELAMVEPTKKAEKPAAIL